jgi:predicted LPLAT superfamily acyltransferase
MTRPKEAVPVWRQIGEVGSDWGLGLMVAVSLWLGRRPARVLLRLVALYYLLFHSAIRKRSRDFLRTVGAASGRRAVYRHLLHFAECTLDRLFFLRGATSCLDLRHHGHEQLAELARGKRGALLLGAHLGSFESLRSLGQACDLPLHVVADVRNAARFQKALSRLVPPERLRFIDAGGSPAELALKIHAAVRRGELVAMLADRVSGPRTVAAPFLGREAHFPAGPFLMAAALECPVYLTFGLYFPPRRYELHCELLAEAIHLPRAEREAALSGMVATYAARLEQYCRLAPFNWFNFFDFFRPPPPPPPKPPASLP